MPNESRQPPGERASRRTLTERVAARVAEAGRSLDERSERRRRSSYRSSGAGPADPREAQSIDRVYREMRTLYRSYRRRTRRPAVAELRQAVLAFREGPSLPRLVVVAGFLDDRKLLDW